MKKKEGTGSQPMEELMKQTLTGRKAAGDVQAPEAERLKQENEELKAKLAQAEAESALLKERVKELEKESTLDDLTGLRRRKNFEYEANRLLVQVIKDRLHEEVVEEGERRHGTEPRPEKPNEFTVIMLDIDDFKSINDTYGHAGGDETLRTVAAVIRNTLRDETDLVGRWGGEEIIIAVRHHPGYGFTVAERIRRAIEDISITVGKRRVPVTASFGIAKWQTGESLEEVTSHADEAMYKAKGAGKNRVWPYQGVEGVSEPLSAQTTPRGNLTPSSDES